MALTLANLRTLTKQYLGGRTSTQLDDDWYDARINESYREVVTFQGDVKFPDFPRPRFRVLRFFELEDYIERDLDENMTDNFVDITASPGDDQVAHVLDIYNETDRRPLLRISTRAIRRRDHTRDGRPREWAPAGYGGKRGYYIYPWPDGTAGYAISVREYVYRYPTALSQDSHEPIIPDAWHPLLAIKAAELGARLIDWQEKAAEMQGKFIEFIAERRSPFEEAGFGGGRRRITITG
jgi:hypothetical protein